MISLRPRLAACVGVLCLLAMRVATSAPQVTVISGPPPGARTGLIAGRVVDAAGRPIPDAVVRVNMPKYDSRLPTTPRSRVLTDSDGRFFFSDLPPGDFSLGASKEGYLGGTFGMRQASGDSLQLALAEHERRTDVKLILWKYAVISGAVTDEAGEPAVGVTVQALVRTVVAGHYRFGTVSSAPFLIPAATTDDRGQFKMSVAPGTYIVVVPSTEMTVPLSVLSAASQDRTLMSSIFSAGINEVAPLGSPHTQQVGDVAVLTPNHAMTPLPVGPEGRLSVYRTTYFPSSATAAAATPITLDDGQARDDVAISVRPMPAVRVSGRVLKADGTPPSPTGVRLVGAAAADVGEEGFETAVGVTDSGGHFTLLGVPPGDYVLKNADRAIYSAAQRDLESWFIAQRVSVGTADITDLAVAAKPPLRIEGRVEIAADSGGQATPAALRNRFVPFDPQQGDRPRLLGIVKPDLTFTTLGAPGRYIVGTEGSGGLFLKSVTLDGKDITDQVLDLQTDIASLVVTLTSRPTPVSGVARDAHGAPATDASVLIFPLDAKLRVDHGAQPRNVKSTVTSRTGAFVFADLPPGDYFAIAIDSTATDGWRDPARLDALAREATRVTVIASQPKSVDLTLKEVK